MSELVNRLRRLANEVDDDEVREAADHIESLTAQLEAQRWISVRERLPEKSDYYWVYGHDPRGKSVARDKRILFRFEYQEWESVSNWIITHWKPITPPKEDA